MSPDIVEDRLAELSDVAYVGVQPPADLATQVLGRYRRRRRLQMVGALGSIVVIVAAVIVGGQSIAHTGATSTPPHPLASNLHSPPPPPSSPGVGRHGNHLVYANPGTLIPVTHNGTTIWNSPKLPAADGLPGSGVFAGNQSPTGTNVTMRSARLVITRSWTSLRVTLSTSLLTGKAAFRIGEARYDLVPGQGQVTGRFRAVGGPVGSASKPLSGQLALRAKSAFGLDITVGPTGRYTGTLPAATYRLTGHSPQLIINGQPATCTADHTVEIQAHKTTHVDVDCQRR